MVNGTLQAPNLDEASRALAQQGYRVTHLQDTAKAQVAAPPPPVAPVQINAPQPAPRPQQQAVSPPRAAVKTPQNLGEPVKTKLGTDKDTYFLFSQLASYFKSGINPAQAFNDVGNRIRREDYREAFHRVAKNVGEGRSIADTLELYPYLFPPHIPGTIRAGETGGYLPEAFMALSDQADSSRKFRRWFVWLGWAAVGVLICFPLGKAGFDGAVRSWDVQEKTGGQAPGAATFVTQVWEVIKWPVGPIALIATVLLIVASFIWQSMRFRSLRHRLALLVPAVTKRAKAESFAAFSWNMSNLSKAGVPPQRVWQLASATVPNQAIREALDEQGRRMTERTKLSEALFNLKMMPEEYAPMVQTGEVTGDVPGQLMNAARMSQEDFNFQDKSAKTRVGCWILIVSLGLGTLLIYALYSGFLQQMIHKVTDIGD